MKETHHQRSSSNESILLVGLQLLSLLPEESNNDESEIHHNVPASIASLDLSSSSDNDDFVYSDDDKSFGMEDELDCDRSDIDQQRDVIIHNNDSTSDQEMISNSESNGNSSSQLTKKRKVSTMTSQEHEEMVKLLLSNEYRNKPQVQDSSDEGIQYEEVEIELIDSRNCSISCRTVWDM